MIYSRLYDEVEKTIREHRWIESEKAGRDMGLAAEQEWISKHWTRFFRSRFVLHLRGDTFYAEFGGNCFAAFSAFRVNSRTVLDEILLRVADGAENLDLICLARKQAWPCDETIKILAALRLNDYRLEPPCQKAGDWDTNQEAQSN